jgi:hypothetical protein
VTFEAEDGAVALEEVMLTGEDNSSMVESD